MFERLEAHMNLPLSNAVNPALASALHNVTTPAPAQGGALSSALGSASNMRDDFAQHFARLARQSQPRPLAPEPGPQRQHLATDANHRPDARFVASKPATPTGAGEKEPKNTQKISASANQAPKPDEPNDMPAAAGQEDAEKQARLTGPEKTPSAQQASEAETNSDVVEENTSSTPTDAMATASNEAAWAAMVPEGLKTLQISERLQVITTDEPLPDPQSNAQFARSMGFDEQMIQRLFGTTPAAGLGQGVGQMGEQALTSAQTLALATSAPTAAAAANATATASAMAALTTNVSTHGVGSAKTVGDLLDMGAQQVQVTDLGNAPGAVGAQASLNMPSASTQNMLAMLSAFVPNADSKRLNSDNNTEFLGTIDLGSAVGDLHGNPINQAGPQGVRPNALSAASNTAAPASADMAQAFQDLSDKLSTELAGRMHQQLNEGQWKMKFGLKPSHLGAVDVELEMRDGKLTALINTDNATTQQLLNHGSPRLREALNGLGWSQASVNIGQGQSSSAQSGQGQGQNPGQPGHHLSSGESANGQAMNDAPLRSTQTSNALLDIYA